MEAPKQDFSETIDKVDHDERLLALIKRHPFGIIKIYVQSAVGIAGAIALIAFLLPGFIDIGANSDAYALMVVGILIVAAIMIIILMIATIIYYQSNIRVTTKTITQTLQLSLFAKKTSQLSVTSIEDVTSNKNGFFPTMFNFGRLMIETAGEQENFHFDYCPHPDHYAKLILDTRQQYLGRRDEEVLHPSYRVNNYADAPESNAPTSAPVESAQSAPAPQPEQQQPVAQAQQPQTPINDGSANNNADQQSQQ
jgi:uncharacterized membrane protein YdbT with pleckstrin-like domain